MSNPLGEVFGFPIENQTDQANRYRRKKLCPYNNKVPNCTKDKAQDPLGVCSIIHNNGCVITCPIRFREEWLIVDNAANFFFPEDQNWTSLTEIRLNDANGQSAGNIDFVLVSYDDRGRLTDFGSLEVQGVYITGNLRNPFYKYMDNPSQTFFWDTKLNYPKPDYLSSSRKRLIPQMLYKGGIFKHWSKKQAVALQKSFFDTLPDLPQVSKEKADIVWYLYDLVLRSDGSKYDLQLVDTIYTEFEPALLTVTNPLPGKIEDFKAILQDKLDEKLENPPDAPTLRDILNQ